MKTVMQRAYEQWAKEQIRHRPVYETDVESWAAGWRAAIAFWMDGNSTTCLSRSEKGDENNEQ